MSRTRWALAVFAVVGAFAQAQTPPVPPAAAPLATLAPDQSTYRLQAGDSVDIRFFYDDELNTKAQIRPDGRISMPLLGEVEIASLTVGELSAKLAALYKGTIRRPENSVQVEGFANRRIFIGGEVGRPGMLPLVGRQTLLGAIYEAGGLTRNAKKSEVTLIRRGADGNPELLRLSLREEGPKAGSLDQGPAFALQPLDVIVVHESGVAKADRFVDQYIRQMIPALLTGGFTYLFNQASLLPVTP